MKPDSNTIEEKIMSVGNGHKLYAQLWGNPNGLPVVFLHGGPGSGCSDNHKSLFDPAYHKVLFFDQRGSGNSTPMGSLKHNTTEDLVADITKLTDEFGLERFVLTGGSWGSCLALVYAIQNPERVISLVIRGIFTGRQTEIEFLDQGRFQAFFPDVWENFAQSVPEKFRHDPGQYHQPRIFGDDPKAAKESAFEYSKMEGAVMSLDDRARTPAFEDFDPQAITVEMHYLVNNCFLEEGYVFTHAQELKMPVYLLQGRFDAVCPPYTAFELSKLLPNNRLIWTTAGHSGNDRANWEITKTLLREQQA